MDMGPLPASERVSLVLTLAPSQERDARLQQFLAEVVRPGSAVYHHWVTPSEFAAKFGATEEQIAAARQWGEAAGLAVDAVSPDRMRMQVSGFPGQVERAFGITLHLYRNGKQTFFAPSNAFTDHQKPFLSTADAALFRSVDGLSSQPMLTMSEEATTLSQLGDLIDANLTSLVVLGSASSQGKRTLEEVAGLRSLLQQASAQGMTILTSTAEDLANLPEVTALASADSLTAGSIPPPARPLWQVAKGLPEDDERHAPDLETDSVASLAATLRTIAKPMEGGRLGNINPVLYTLACVPGIFRHDGEPAAATWRPGDGLGSVDLQALAKHYPRGTGTSYTSFAASSYTPVHGANVTFTSSVTSGTGGSTPTGSVSFVTAAGTVLGTGTLVNGTATVVSNVLPGGSTAVQAEYSGDGTYAVSTSPSGTLLVQLEPGQLAATVSTNNVIGGTFSVTVTDAAASGVGTPTGTVTVAVSGTAVSGSAPLVTSGANSSTATVTLPAKTVGNQTLSISCSADASFSCDNPLTKGVTVGRATPVLTFNYSPTTLVAGGTVTLNASLPAVGTAPVPSGNVEFFDGTTVLNASTLSNGTTSTTGVLPNTGTHTLSATYDGDASYNAVTVSSTSKSPGSGATTTVLSVSSNTVTTAQSVVLTATVAAASAGSSSSPSGTVSFSSASQGVLGTAALSGGVATLSLKTLPAGSYSIKAAYAGDANFAASTSSPATALTVTAASANNAILAATISPATAAPGATATVSATLMLAGATPPSGTLLASIPLAGASSTNAGTLVPSGTNTATATIPLTVPPAGSYQVTVACPANAGYTCNTISLALTSAAPVKIATTTLLTLTPAVPVAGVPVILAAAVTPASAGAAVLSGTVSFFNGTKLLGTSAVASGVASLSVTLVSAGAQTLTAVYAGDANYAASTSAGIATGGTLLASTITLSENASQVLVGGVVSLTAQVSAVTSGAAVPTGSVSFYVSGATPVLLGKSTLTPTGPDTALATLFTSRVPVGMQTVYAIYSGDSVYATASAPGIGLGVADYSIAFTPASLNLTAGQSAQVTLAISTVGGFSGDLAISCIPANPEAITCSSTPGAVTNGGVASLTVTTRGAKLQARLSDGKAGTPSKSPLKAVGGVAAAGLLFLLLPAGKSRRHPTLLLLLLAISLGIGLGCSQANIVAGNPSPGTSLGTTSLAISTSASDGRTTLSHNYTYQITIQ